jgi:lipopolysaccharide export LptBFGC system permease protein LptF
MTPGRTGSRRGRRAAAILVLAATLLLAAFIYVVGLLSDWSGQHRVPPETTIGALVVLAIGALVSFAILRRGS